MPNNTNQTAVAYLVNQYPHVSHSFIRREIRALTEKGIRVERFSIRRPAITLVDAGDLEEQSRTHVLLDAGVLRLLVVCFATALRHPLRWSRAAIQAFRMARRSGRSLHRHFAYLAEACLLTRRMRTVGVRHLHAHFGTNSTDVALLAHVLDGVPYSFTIHGPEEFDRPESLSLGDKIARATFVVTVSDFGRSQAFRWCAPECWSKIHVVHCGVDDSFLRAPETEILETLQLVCVGRLCEQKGQMLLLQAFAGLKVDAHLILAGDGPMRPLLEAEIERLGLTGRVRITGWITNDEVRRLLNASRAMVLPSFAEGLPLVLMEALALSRPVISTYVAGIPELVRPGESGWLVPAGSVEALTHALGEVLSATPEQLAKMGLAGASWIRIHHDACIEAEKLAMLFRPAIFQAKRELVPPSIAEVRRDLPRVLTPRSRSFEGSQS